jgi:hypothetical protein
VNSDLEDRPFPAHVVKPVREDFTQLEELGKALANGQAAIEELNLLKPVFALALSKLEKRQLHVRLEELATLGEKFTMQAKSDGKGGIILRSVTVL